MMARTYQTFVLKAVVVCLWDADYCPSYGRAARFLRHEAGMMRVACDLEIRLQCSMELEIDAEHGSI